MDKTASLWGYVGRFALVHVLVYVLMALPFMLVQGALPTANRTALAFFQPFGLDAIIVPAQLVRGVVVALLLYPFYETIVRHPRGWFVLFGVLWGVTLLGAVEPIPGSIEGLIYTETTLLEHGLVLAVGALQTVLFCWLFLRWERGRDGAMPVADVAGADTRRRGYLFRFVLLHVISYTLIGIVFMTLQDYEAAFETQAQFALFRPLDHPLVEAVVFIQIVRGLLLAWLLYPFYATYMARQHGWLLLFGLMFGLTALGSALLIPAMAQMLVQDGSIAPVLVGLPEVFVQMLLFSIALFAWERWARRHEQPRAAESSLRYPSAAEQ